MRSLSASSYLPFPLISICLFISTFSCDLYLPLDVYLFLWFLSASWYLPFLALSICLLISTFSSYPYLPLDINHFLWCLSASFVSIFSCDLFLLFRVSFALESPVYSSASTVSCDLFQLFRVYLALYSPSSSIRLPLFPTDSVSNLMFTSPDRFYQLLFPHFPWQSL